MMTRKHFNAIAAALKESNDDLVESITSDDDLWLLNRAHEYTCYNIANVCAAENPNFDRKRFLEACGVQS